MDVNGVKTRRSVKLQMVRGDNEKISVKINGVTPSASDKVEFTVRRDPSDAEKLISKTATEFVNGAYTIAIEPADTADLEPDTYVYDIQLTLNGEIKTIVPCSVFEVQAEVTYGD